MPSFPVRSLAIAALGEEPSTGAFGGLSQSGELSGYQFNNSSFHQSSSGAYRSTLSTKLEDWAEHWPFPSFEKAVKQQQNQQDDDDAANIGASPSASPQRYSKKTTLPPTNRRESQPDDASDSSDEEAERPPRQAESHHLASDWTMTSEAASMNTMNTSCGSAYRAIMSSRPASACSTRSVRTTHNTSRANSIGSNDPFAFGMSSTSFRADPNKTIVSKDEITSLISVYDRSNAIAGEVNMNHIDCRWLTERHDGRITPPSLYLHLGNLAEALDSEKIRDKQVLINSPRSAIIFLRNGITLDELKRDPRGVPQKRALVDLTWDEKKLIALEKSRQKKIAMLTKEYMEMDEGKCSFDDVVQFCSSFQPSRPSTALAISFPTDTRPVTAASRLPSNITRSKMDTMRTTVEQRMHRAAHARQETQRLVQENQERIVTRQLKKQQIAERRKQERLQERKTQAIISSGKDELWKASHDKSVRVKGFRRLVARERMERRLDEVQCIQQELHSAEADFQGWVLRSRLEDSRNRSATDASYLKRARQQFLASQV